MKEMQAAMGIDKDDITCGDTLEVCARLSVDAACCLPCCCFCGGCCGKFRPCIAGAFPEEFSKESGYERFGETCMAQLFAGFFMPSTFCGCLWACCGLATPCTRFVINKVESRESSSAINHVDLQMHAPSRASPATR
jgi:hypothetical protein